MKPDAVSFGIFIPRIIYILLYLLRIIGLYLVYLAQVAVQDNSPWHFKAIRIIITICREVAKRHIVRETSANGSPVAFVERCYCKKIGNINLVDKSFSILKKLSLIHISEPTRRTPISY